MRGEVYRFTPRHGMGHEQRGPRYAIVVQLDRLLHLSTWFVVPTSTTAAMLDAPFRPVIEVAGRETKALCDHAGAVDQHRLGEHVGQVSTDELQRIEEGLRLILGL